MNALLIALGALAVGKIHGQDTVVSFIINTQRPAIYFNRRPIVYQEISEELQPPKQPSFQDRDRSEAISRSNLNLPFRTKTTEIRQRLTNIAVTRQPTRMDLPSNIRNETSRVNANNTTARNNNKQNEDLAATSPPKQELPVSPKDAPARDNVTSSEKPNNTVIIPPPKANVTLDERSNFDGDKCPTGFVRVNGKCVEED